MSPRKHRTPPKEPNREANLLRLEGPTHALSVTLSRLVAEYFSLAEDAGLTPEGVPAVQFFIAVGRMLGATASLLVEDGSPRSEDDLVTEYLGAIREGIYASRKAVPQIRFN